MPSLMTRLRRALAPAREQKTSHAGQLFALNAFGQPRWTSRNESALAREGYERNAICHRCVRMIAEAVASIPWLIYEGETEAVDHPLHDLLAQRWIAPPATPISIGAYPPVFS